MLTLALLLLQGLSACTTPATPTSVQTAPAAKPVTGRPSAVRSEKNPFSVVVAPLTLQAGGVGQAELVFKVPAGTYLYREMARVQVLEAGTLEIDAADLPPGVMRFDEAFGREREVWEFDAIAMLPLTAPSQVGSYTVLLDVGYQGCRGGLCFMPVQSELELILNVTESQ